MANASSENSTYAKFDEKIRRSIRSSDVKAISKLKIVDLSKYMDKRFKAIKILQGSTQSATHCKIDESDAKDNGWHNLQSGNLEKQLPQFDKETKAYTFNNNNNKNDDRSGFILIPGCLSPQQQIFWSHHILNDLSQPSMCKSSFKPETLFENNLYREYVVECSRCYKMQQQKSGCDKQEVQGKYEKRIKALKWTTYGYHFDFVNEMYGPQHHCNSGSTPGGFDDDKWHSEIPPTFAALASHILNSLGITSHDGLQFQPDTAFVNFYIDRDRKPGHKNDKEHDKGAPVLGISLLSDGIFLLGGQTSATQPIPIKLHSGDVFIMHGKSRYSIHGISCILSNTANSQVLDGLVNYTMSCMTLPSEEGDDEATKKHKHTHALLRQYLTNLRICVNIRQVYKRRNEAQHKFYFLKNHEITYY
eukprot:g5325.t1